MGLEENLPSGVLLTSVEKLVNWTRKSSLWPGHVRPGLLRDRDDDHRRARATTSARFGMEVFRASPRQADLMIVAGRVSQKMAPVLRQIYDQMPEPRWVLAMGVCACSGGMFNNYAIVQGVDHVVPGRHVPARLPAAPGDAHRRDPQDARQDHGRAAGPKRAAELAASGHKTELVPSSIKFAPKGKRHERETALGAPNELRALAERGEDKR